MKRKAIADANAENNIILFFSIAIVEVELDKALFFFNS